MREQSFAIRLSVPKDIDRIMEVYDSAKHFMRSCGNFKQWLGGYPDEKTILNDISRNCHYIAEDEVGNLMMVYTFIIGEDPTYKVIENGAWLNDRPYGTIHRIASSGLQGGMLKACVKYCATLIDNIRIDTHAENGPMQYALNELNFKHCGIIYTDDGSPRLAFQKDFRSEIILPLDFKPQYNT